MAGYSHDFYFFGGNVANGKAKDRKLAFLDCGRYYFYADDDLQRIGDYRLTIFYFYDFSNKRLLGMEKNHRKKISLELFRLTKNKK